MTLKTAKDVGETVRSQAQQRRIALRLTQSELAERSGVSLGSLKRFERTGEISWVSLLALAEALDVLSDFERLFAAHTTYATIGEVVERPSVRKRVRHA